MRYIGNKTKLLDFIGEFLADAGISWGRAFDAFSGTASVGSYLKSRGFAVTACDIMTFSYVFQRAYIVTDTYPTFTGLGDDEIFDAARNTQDFLRRLDSRFHGQEDLFGPPADETRPLGEVLLYLDTWLEPLTSFISMHYGPSEDSGEAGRMYFTRENARRIDAIRHQIHEWRRRGMITDDEYYVLLAALLEAADAVANTTGVYAAFVKTWQGNAVKPLRLPVPSLVVGSGLPCEAYQGDLNTLIGTLGRFDLLYLDPPYNTRQYSAYYHIPELIAEGWFDGEPVIRGKTGLIPDREKKSQWSSRETCVSALEDLISRADTTHVLMSYNNEGIIPDEEIERIFRSNGMDSSYCRVSRRYPRYRSDADSDARRYKSDETMEYLYYVRLC